MSEYTPTMDEIKGWYAGAVDEYRCDTGMSMDEAEVAFDRAIAAHDREVREQVARDIEATETELAELLEAFVENESWESTGVEMARTIIGSIGRGIRGEGQTHE